ncbi:MAG TPA: hypothetical protein VKB54_01290 [Solirubrobacteraceae bacterium]|nr:hypothetical protein [Solirubrobacteraceae bacterium]
MSLTLALVGDVNCKADAGALAVPGGYDGLLVQPGRAAATAA